MFCFPNSDHGMFSWEFAFCLFINYAYICRWMHAYRTMFERHSSLGYHHVVWTYKLKGFISQRQSNEVLSRLKIQSAFSFYKQQVQKVKNVLNYVLITGPISLRKLYINSIPPRSSVPNKVNNSLLRFAIHVLNYL